MRELGLNCGALVLILSVGTAHAGDPSIESVDSVTKQYERGFGWMERGVWVIPELLERMVKEDQFAAEMFERLMCESDPVASAVKPLVKALRHSNPTMRACAAFGAWRLDYSDAWAELLPALSARVREDSSTQVRLHALRALAHAGAGARRPVVYAAIEQALTDSDPKVVNAAAVAAAWIRISEKHGGGVARRLELLSDQGSENQRQVFLDALHAFRGKGRPPAPPKVEHPLRLVPANGPAPSYTGRLTRDQLRAEGGGRPTVDAVSLALYSLVRAQGRGGSWGSVKESCLVMLALLTAGYTDRFVDAEHSSRHFAHQPDMRRAAARALRRGLYDLIHSDTDYELAAQVMAEAYGMTGDPMYRREARMRVTRLLQRKNISVWGADALDAAQRAGIDVPLSAIRRANASSVGGRVWIRMLAKRKVNLQPLRNDPPTWSPRTDLERLLFGTRAMFQVGEADWKTWNSALRRALLRSQNNVESPEAIAGSWEPRGRWSRMATTAILARALSVYHDRSR